MIKKINLQPFATYDRAIIGGTYVSDTQCLYLVSMIEGDIESDDKFVLTNLSSDVPTTTVHSSIDEVTEVLKTLEARVINIEIKETMAWDIKEIDVTGTTLL
jgi:hypothetical protein